MAIASFDLFVDIWLSPPGFQQLSNFQVLPWGAPKHPVWFFCAGKCWLGGERKLWWSQQPWIDLERIGWCRIPDQMLQADQLRLQCTAAKGEALLPWLSSDETTPSDVRHGWPEFGAFQKHSSSSGHSDSIWLELFVGYWQLLTSNLFQVQDSSFKFQYSKLKLLDSKQFHFICWVAVCLGVRLGTWNCICSL